RRILTKWKLVQCFNALKYRNLAGKNGVYDVRCHPAARPTFWWGEGASRF
ncbi:hypothetical protein QBC45DRAFT_340058, partial [Copromyces sp. CBS 386.78]